MEYVTTMAAISTIAMILAAFSIFSRFLFDIFNSPLFNNGKRIQIHFRFQDFSTAS